ncbi:hypothetical protein AB5N19_09992 [Seiridium cardinale]
MRFTQSLTSLFVTGLLTTSALGATIGRPASRSIGANGIKRRDGLNKDDFEKMAKTTCEKHFRKRSILAARAGVDLREAKGAGPNEELDTDELSTCIGIVVTGTRKEGKKPDNHFMAHLVMDGSEEDTYDNLEDKVKDAQGDLNNIKGYITIADISDNAMRHLIVENLKDDDSLFGDLGDDQYNGDIPDDADDVDPSKLSDDLVKDNKSFYTDKYSNIQSKLKSFVGIAGQTTHDPLQSNDMSSDGKGVVKVNGRQI